MYVLAFVSFLGIRLALLPSVIIFAASILPISAAFTKAYSECFLSAMLRNINAFGLPNDAASSYNY